MVRYIPPARRRRRIAAAALASLVVGMVAGVLIGRATTTTAGEQISAVRDEAAAIATRVQALTIEYDQAIAAQGDTIQAGVLDPLAGIIADAQRTMVKAAWLGTDDRAAVEAALDAVRRGAVDQVDSARFATLTSAAATVIGRQLGGAA
jgi:hypothetical protein